MPRPKTKPAKALDSLTARIADRQAIVGVIGLGYVGLPLIRAFGEKGFRTLGFDIDPAKVKALNAGRSYIRQIPASAIRRLRDGERFRATTDFAELAAADAVLICGPTPLTRQREPDMTYITDTSEMVARHLRRGQLVVLESTTYPGTTIEVMK